MTIYLVLVVHNYPELVVLEFSIKPSMGCINSSPGLV